MADSEEGELLTPWESLMMTMSIEDYLELCPCDCHSACECEE